jgi:hypothetical protein
VLFRSTLGAGALAPALATPSGLAAVAALQGATFEAPVLASDPFRVCYEGSHAPAYAVAVALLLGFSVAFPLASFAAVYHAVSQRMESTAIAGRAARDQWLLLRKGWMPRLYELRSFLCLRGGCWGAYKRR